METDSANNKPIQKHDLDISKSEFEVLGVVPSNTLDSLSSSPESSTSKVNNPAKLKENVVSNSSKSRHQKDSDNLKPGFEESGLMRISSNNGEPRLERNISQIPQDDNDDNTLEPPGSNFKASMSPQLEKRISRLPEDDYDSETEEKPSLGGTVEKHDSGTAGSDFEVGGLIGMRSDDSGRKSPVKDRKLELDRHISSIPQRDDEEDAGGARMSKLERTISSVPQD